MPTPQILGWSHCLPWRSTRKRGLYNLTIKKRKLILSPIPLWSTMTNVSWSFRIRLILKTQWRRCSEATTKEDFQERKSRSMIAFCSWSWVIWRKWRRWRPWRPWRWSEKNVAKFSSRRRRSWTSLLPSKAKMDDWSISLDSRFSRKYFANAVEERGEIRTMYMDMKSRDPYW